MLFYFEDEEYEYEPEISYRELVSILKNCDKDLLIDMLLDISDYNDIKLYLEEDIRDMYEDEAYEQYLTDKDYDSEIERLYFEFMENR